MTRTLKAYLQSRAGQAATGAVLLFGLLLGYGVRYTWFGHVARTYPAQWQASWIAAPSHPASQSYFRKTIYLTHPVRHAWLKVMSPDQFRVYINGKPTGQANRIATNVTGFMDLSGRLHPGLNVIAIATHRSTYPGRSAIAAEGAYEDWQGVTHSIMTDENWRVTPFEEWQRGSNITWSEPDFKDDHWTSAEVLGPVKPSDHSKTPYPPSLYTRAIPQQWLWAESPTAQQVYLRHRVELSKRPVDAWLRLGTKQGYHLMINGVTVGQRQTPDVYHEIDQRNDASSNRSPRYPMDIYNIAPFLQVGSNAITIRAQGERSERGLLTDSVMFTDDDQTRWITPPAGWRIATTEHANWTAASFDDAAWAPAQTHASHVRGERFIKRLMDRTPSPRHQMITALQTIGVVGVVTAGAIMFWLATSLAFARWEDISFHHATSLVSSTYGLPIVFLLSTRLISYDIRFDTSFPYQENLIFFSIVLLFLCCVFLFIFSNFKKTSDDSRAYRSSYHHIIILILILLLGFLLRLHKLAEEPLSGDEVTMTLVSQHILDHGYPALSISSVLREKIMTTSEIVPYTLAASMALYADQPPEFQIRFPGVFFGTLTILLLYIAGKRLFDSRVGLLAAALFAGLPLAINVAQFARYPSQTQFYALLTAYLLYRCFIATPLNHRYLAFGVVAMILTYLSWEGTGLFIPAVSLGLITLKGKDFSYFKDKYFWLALLFLILVVLLQLGLRYLLNKGIPIVGTGIGDLSPVPRWEQPKYDPFIFVKNLFFLKNLFLVSIFSCLGLISIAFKDRTLRYCYLLVLIPIINTTNIIEVQSTRHIYYVLPFILLTGSYIFFKTLNFLTNSYEHRTERPVLVFRYATRIACIMLLLFTANDYVLKLHDVPITFMSKHTLLEHGDNQGIRSVAATLKQHARPGDKVVAMMPHKVLFYYGKVDYYAEPYLRIPVIVSNREPIAVHRATGSPFLQSPEQLQDVLNQHRRVWLVLSKPFAKYLKTTYPEMISQMSLAFEGEDRDASVYLWEH